MLKKLLTILFVGCICLSTSTLIAQSIIHSENFNTNTSGDWTAVDVLGTTDVWLFTTGFASMNGFGDQNDEDWLVSPDINMDNSTAETFNFKYKNRFSGPLIELYYTTNYTGSPTTTTWTAIALPSLVNNTTATASASFTTYSGINVSALTGTVRFAFKYFGTSTLTKEWQIDDIEVLGTLPCVAPTTQATTFFASPSNTSATISWAKGDGSNSLVLLNTTNSFTAPVDGTTYTPNTVYAGGQQSVYTGTGTSINVTGLTALTTYYVQVYNFQTCALPIDYITASPLSGSFTTTNVAAPDCAAFRASIKAGLPAHITLGYNTARSRMYGNCDNQSSTVTCVYGGYVASHPFGSSATSIGLPNGKIINAEHTIPQSFFSQADPMVSDMCHLFPTYETWNGVRSNFPFSEIPDAQTTQWHLLLNAATSSIPSSNIGDYSEAKTGTYEPRDIQKGNTARAIFYFYTVYESIMNTTYSHPITDVASIQTLYNWHIQDPVTAADIARNDCIKSYQGNGNPYIDHPEWVAQAFGCGLSLPVELISFEGKNKDTYNALTWKTATEKNAQYFLVERKDNDKWLEVGRVKAVGNSAETQNYALDDLNPLPLSIYRLKTVDVDGTETVSKIITISRTEKAFTLKMFPNPAKDFVTFRTNTTENQAFNVTITDISGRILIQKSYDITSGGVDNHINISALTNGIYFFSFDNGIRKTTERFVRQ
jgi:Endonuclease I/Secretion system C-terminal sorting domain